MIIDEARMFVAGGFTAAGERGMTAAAYLYHTDSLEWTNVGEMPGGARHQMGCGVARYPDGSLKVSIYLTKYMRR